MALFTASLRSSLPEIRLLTSDQRLLIVPGEKEYTFNQTVESKSSNADIGTVPIVIYPGPVGKIPSLSTARVCIQERYRRPLSIR